VTSTVTKYANKSFLSQLGGFCLHFSLGVEGWLWIRCVVGFGWFECFLLFVVVGARNELRSTLLTLILTSLNHEKSKKNSKPKQKIKINTPIEINSPKTFNVSSPP
jgi:hypothetical protein